MTRNDTATTLRIVNPKIASPAAVAAGLRPSTVSVNAAIQGVKAMAPKKPSRETTTTRVL